MSALDQLHKLSLAPVLGTASTAHPRRNVAAPGVQAGPSGAPRTADVPCCESLASVWLEGASLSSNASVGAAWSPEGEVCLLGDTDWRD